MIATVVAMFLLDWRLAVFALALLPFFVWLTRRVGSERKRITTKQQESMADIALARRRSRSRSRASCSARRWAARTSSPSASSGESERLAELEVRSRMAGRWLMASIQMSFAVMPALVYWFAGLSPSRTAPAPISHRHARRLHDAADAAVLPDRQPAHVAIDIQTSLALFDRIFEYLDLPVDITEAADAAHAARAVHGEVRFEHVWFRYEPTRRPGRSPASTSTCPPGTTTAIVGETGCGQDDARLPRLAALRRRRGAR